MTERATANFILAVFRSKMRIENALLNALELRCYQKPKKSYTSDHISRPCPLRHGFSSLGGNFAPQVMSSKMRVSEDWWGRRHVDAFKGKEPDFSCKT
jgi:hypothetical protein